ncbi:replication protein [Cytobacillus depressus]|uniref:Replication protein n=1 Tax=Cytobacillus depressus TaxID=1602942 RepID=A0A6L3V948_9BACI|nr:poly-gamma-glutamate hydrolase family protein [Cytobacillus depressus]KAB2334824.1 replication protein [Cytobacillus depressus]
MADTYANYKELAAVEVKGVDYDIHYHKVNGSKTIIFTPHGGGIEPGTSELVKAVATSFYNWYEFDGMKPSGNSILHITSTHFDEPIALKMVGESLYSMALHGYNDTSMKHTNVGGLDYNLRDRVIKELKTEGFSAGVARDGLSGTEPKNITNRTSRGKGVQLEISTLQRQAFFINADTSRANRINTTDVFKKYVKALQKAMG